MVHPDAEPNAPADRPEAVCSRHAGGGRYGSLRWERGIVHRSRREECRITECHKEYSAPDRRGAPPPDPGAVSIYGGWAQRLVMLVHNQYRCCAYSPSEERRAG